MPLTVLVRSTNRGEARLTFDGMQPVVVGRGASCDVRLPDASVSFRHASIRAQGTDFVLTDEGSTNGTFVGGVRIAPRTSRLVRSGDLVRVGRVWIELRIDQSAVTRDVANATRDVALGLVAQALDDMGTDRTIKLRVLEGRDLGAVLPLAEEGRVYVLGRGAECDLPLADGDSSREHAHVVRRGSSVTVRDLGAKNGTWLGETPVPSDREVSWRTTQLLRIGRTIVAVEEPLGDALARIESAPDEAIPAHEEAPTPPGATPPAELRKPLEAEPSSAAPMAAIPAAPPALRKKRPGWSATDLTVMAAAVGVLALSIAGLVWLLRP